ncbi:MAG: hypothetical protein M0010_20600 [Actinomycetota bacterium]|jgi:hypothetical protein|nr:hypothetical protein [Actinomycetota bacterium]
MPTLYAGEANGAQGADIEQAFGLSAVGITRAIESAMLPGHEVRRVPLAQDIPTAASIEAAGISDPLGVVVFDQTGPAGIVADGQLEWGAYPVLDTLAAALSTVPPHYAQLALEELGLA